MDQPGENKSASNGSHPAVLNGLSATQIDGGAFDQVQNMTGVSLQQFAEYMQRPQSMQNTQSQQSNTQSTQGHVYQLQNMAQTQSLLQESAQIAQAQIAHAQLAQAQQSAQQMQILSNLANLNNNPQTVNQPQGINAFTQFQQQIQQQRIQMALQQHGIQPNSTIVLNEQLLNLLRQNPNAQIQIVGQQQRQQQQAQHQSQQQKPKVTVTVEELAQQDKEVDAQDDELVQAETYAEYMPSKLKIGQRHPDPVVETSSLATVIPPDIICSELPLPKRIIDNGLLSALQLEAVVYACQQHERILPDGKTRAGFLVGDGAGVGKGRTIAGIIYANWLEGRRKAVWLSVSTDLKYDAERDLKDIGARSVPVYLLSKFVYGRRINSYENGNIKEGVIFSTYAGLISESQSSYGALGSRLGQLLQWLGGDFDGCIIFDECHKAKNIYPVGKGKPSKTAQYALDIQEKLPNSRVVYASATGASEPRNLGYMTRLGIWGRGTPFPEFDDFCRSVERRGVGAMELVAVDLKMRGAYMARQLSFKGVTFTIQKVPLEQEYIEVYDQSAELWMDAKEKFEKALTLFEPEPRERKQIWTQFWSAHQRFFKYLCIGAKVPYVVQLSKKAVEDGKCAVIGLQSTGEAKTLEYMEECGELTDFISTARAVFESLVENYFPAPSRRKEAKMERLEHKFTDGGSPIPLSDDSNVDDEWLEYRKRKREKQAKEQALLEAVRGCKNPSTSNSDFGIFANDRAMRAKRRAGLKAQKRARVIIELDNDEDSSATEVEDGDDTQRDNSDESAFEVSSEDSFVSNSSEDDSDEDFSEQSSDISSSEDEWGGKRKRRNPFEAKKRALKKERKNRHKTTKRLKSENVKNSGKNKKSLIDDSEATDVESDEEIKEVERKDVLPNIKQSAAEDREIVEISDDDPDVQKGANQKKSDQKSVSEKRDLSKEKKFKHTDKIEKVEEVESEEEEERLARIGEELQQMKESLMKEISKLGPKLPNNTLDDLIEKLGGASKVAEMTGRKGRIVSGADGTVNYECRNESDVSLEMLNIAEKERFMNDEKQIAIISEAASSGISLHADRRVKNTRRRVHITIELPWSADRAIQQFGRTHRSNQKSAPEYIFLISDLAGEQRFASIVAKRLESLGALTHGDRRATSESRDLSQFNIINKYGREALDSLLKAVAFKEYRNICKPPDYKGDFFADARKALVGVGLANYDHPFEGNANKHAPQYTDSITIDKEANNTTRFMNRLLGMRVAVQNALFTYFMTTMERAVALAKRMGKHDPGIMEINDTHGKVRCKDPEIFQLKCSSGIIKCELLNVYVERGLSWSEVFELYEKNIRNNTRSYDDGFYTVHNSVMGSTTIFLALSEPSDSNLKETDYNDDESSINNNSNDNKVVTKKLSGKERNKQIFRVYKPNTGLQAKVETFASITDRGKKITLEAAEPIWSRVYQITDTKCSHICFFNNCRRVVAGMKCDVGLRHRQYCILSGGVLTAWPYLEKKAPSVTSKLQIVRINVGGMRLIGPMIPLNLIDQVRSHLKAGEKGVDF